MPTGNRKLKTVKPIKILGLDPGTATTGWGIITYKAPQTFTNPQYGIIATPAQQPMPDRLLSIYQQLHLLISEHEPDVVVVEQLFFNTNAKTAISVGQARGVLILTARQSHLPVHEYTPLQVKQSITGYGQAQKQQVQFMVKNFLHLKTTPKPDDAADALAVALTHAFTNPLLA